MQRISATLSISRIERLVQMRRSHRISVSAIIEHALDDYFSSVSEADFVERLRKKGVLTLRRTRSGKGTV